MLDSADPLEGWPIDEIIQKAPPAKNDIYGSLFFYLQDLLGRFCHHIGRLKVSIQLFQVDARKLPGIIEQYETGQRSFDRIEVRFPRLIPYFACRFCGLNCCSQVHLIKAASLDYFAGTSKPGYGGEVLTLRSFQTSRTVVISGPGLLSLLLARCSNAKPKTRMQISWHYFLMQFMKCILTPTI